MSPSRSVQALAGIFAVSGVIHLVRPEVYEPIVPEAIPAHHEVVLASGVAELVLAAGLLTPATRRLAGWGSIALLVGVFPANLKMANDARRRSSPVLRVGTVARLPLQWPMIRAAYAATRSGR